MYNGGGVMRAYRAPAARAAPAGGGAWAHGLMEQEGPCFTRSRALFAVVFGHNSGSQAKGR